MHTSASSICCPTGPPSARSKEHILRQAEQMSRHVLQPNKLTCTVSETALLLISGFLKSQIKLWLWGRIGSICVFLFNLGRTELASYLWEIAGGICGPAQHAGCSCSDTVNIGDQWDTKTPTNITKIILKMTIINNSNHPKAQRDNIA